MNILRVQQNDGFNRYLGLSEDFGVSKRVVFDEVRQKIGSKLPGRSEQFLSPAGKEILIKAVTLALPNYAIACFKLPVYTGLVDNVKCTEICWRAGIS